MRSTYLQSADALGTTIQLRIVHEHERVVDEWFKRLWRHITTFDERFSRFLKESELSRFNAVAGEQTSISSEFKILLEEAREYAQRTDGAFNPFMLPALQRAGYVHSMTREHNIAPDYSECEIAQPEALEVGDTWARIPKKTALDFGGIGKGYLADELGTYLNTKTKDYCLSLGGDMYVNGETPHGPWVIDVQSAARAEENIGTYSGEIPFGIATSNVTRTKKGKAQAHLVDPRSGEVLREGFDMCTVVASTATAADVFASCILISGESLAQDLYKQGDIRAVLLQKNGQTPFVLGDGFTLVE